MSALSPSEIAESFADRVRAGLKAFASDVSYIVDMAEHASLIAYKRALYEIRNEAQAAEKVARRECDAKSKRRPFLCTTASACGFGGCPFARGDHRDVTACAAGGPKARPEAAQARHATYDPEAAIKALTEQRGVRPPPRLSRATRSRRE